MASVVTAAPPPLALHKLDKRFGATHALKVVIGKWLNPPSSSSSTSRRSAWTSAQSGNLSAAGPLPVKGGRHHDLVLPAEGLRARRHPARLSSGRTGRKPRTKGR